MSIEKVLKEAVDRLFLNVGASFSGVFIDTKPVISKTVYADKKTQLEETLKLIINKAHQINEFLPEFGEEYVYAEGNDVSIFIYFVRPDIAIASVIEEKPKFALLKLEHTAVANKIKSIESQIDSYIKGVPVVIPEEEEKQEEKPEEKQEVAETHVEEEFTEIELPEPQPEKEEEKEKTLEVPEEKEDITVEDVKDRFAEELEMVEKTEDLEELEKVLSTTETEEKEAVEEKLKPPPAETVPLENIIEEENPPLEEILKPETEDLLEETEEVTESLEAQIEDVSYYDPQILDKIQKELLKEIGPVGKFLFKKRMRELNIDEEKLTKSVILQLIDALSNDIIDEKRKNRFVEKVSAFL
ncbi:hypothetical protein [Persephonella sp.]